jgi:molybdenum cofactor cytidylyltransferase
MNPLPAVIVLGAGRGSRFLGTEHKLLQSLGSSTVFGTTLRHAIASQMQVVVVTTEALAEVARRSVAARDVIVLPEADTSPGLARPGSAKPAAGVLGMGYSISAGVSSLPDAGGWLILPADMPLVLPSTLQAVAKELADHAVVYAQHRGRRGHPVGFSAELYSELIALSGDEGARRLVARYPAFGLDVDDSGVLVDVDTQADLDRVRQAELPIAIRAPRW